MEAISADGLWSAPGRHGGPDGVFRGADGVRPNARRCAAFPPRPKLCGNPIRRRRRAGLDKRQGSLAGLRRRKPASGNRLRLPDATPTLGRTFRSARPDSAAFVRRGATEAGVYRTAPARPGTAVDGLPHFALDGSTTAERADSPAPVRKEKERRQRKGDRLLF